MPFLLAESFQSSLDKLNGEEQKAAKLAAFELQINPAKPGLQCHRFDNIKDKNFSSARASRDIRVDNRDPAHDWASRRKIKTQPVTGAAQIVEIRETVVRTKSSSMSPPNQSPLRSPSGLCPISRKPTCSTMAFQPSGSRMSAQRTMTCCW